MGKGQPNHPGYSMVGHFWNQKNPDGTKMKHPASVAKIMELGGKSYWSTTFHTYGCQIGLEDTIYNRNNAIRDFVTVQLLFVKTALQSLKPRMSGAIFASQDVHVRSQA